MAINIINTTQIETAVPQTSTHTTVEDYVFESAVQLPQGYWMITIEKGDAWIFTDSRNFTVKAGETTIIEPEEGEISIKRLYVKSTVKFNAQPLA